MTYDVRVRTDVMAITSHPAELGRADHPWSAAVEQGCSSLPARRSREGQDSSKLGRLGEPSLPEAGYVVTRSRPYLARRSRERLAVSG